jgi:hypothetical protein
MAVLLQQTEQLQGRIGRGLLYYDRLGWLHGPGGLGCGRNGWRGDDRLGGRRHGLGSPAQRKGADDGEQDRQQQQVPGHGGQGWALACGSAQILAGALAGRAPDPALAPLSPQRLR